MSVSATIPNWGLWHLNLSHEHGVCNQRYLVWGTFFVFDEEKDTTLTRDGGGADINEIPFGRKTALLWDDLRGICRRFTDDHGHKNGSSL